MKELLIAVKSALGAALTNVRVHVTPHINAFPTDFTLPCVGIKDGAVTRVELINSMLEITLNVIIVVYVSLQEGKEVNIIGDSDEQGVLDIVSDIHEVLDENLLDIAGMQFAFSASEAESISFDYIQQKKIMYKYIKEIAR